MLALDLVLAAMVVELVLVEEQVLALHVGTV